MKFALRTPRKLIEVALPLDAINEAAAREKSIRHGHPSTLHLWWARRPLAAARAVIFAQMVNDPGYQQGAGFKYGMNKKDAAKERQRLFRIIEELVQWENTTNEEVLERARAEIRRSWREVCELNKDHPQAAELFNPDKLPALHDPFAGGGAIPLEAQRLGLEAYASDLNPVAVLINKAMIEIPPKLAGRPPVSLTANERQSTRIQKQQNSAATEESPEFPTIRVRSRLNRDWSGAKGIAEDVRYYGAWMRAEAEKRIGHLYPPVEITVEMTHERPDLKPLVGQKLTVIAWLWARTVKSPNPVFSHVYVPLASTFILSSKEGKESYVHPVVEGDRYRFTVKIGTPPNEAKNGTKLARGVNFRCLLSNVPIEGYYIKAEGQAGRMKTKLMAIVAEGPRERIYISPTLKHEATAEISRLELKPDLQFFQHALGFRVGNYGMSKWSDLFTARQLAMLSTFCGLIEEATHLAQDDLADSPFGIDTNKIMAEAANPNTYAEAIALYLAFSVDKLVARSTTICAWEAGYQKIQHTFGRQAIPMIWDFAEGNPFSNSTGNYGALLEGVSKVIEMFPAIGNGNAAQVDAALQGLSQNKLVSVDPPYYDNVGYADLSEFFYVWLRKSIRSYFPDHFATLGTPKADELVATPDRHGGKKNAETFFLSGMTKAMHRIAVQAHPAFPVTIYYAFKQSESNCESGTTSTGWETFLDAIARAGFMVCGTWPMRTELENRMRGMSSNALASSIVLVCIKRPAGAPTISRREFIRELNTVLPEALDEMTKGSVDGRSPVAPVDLSQAIIGPGIAVFSKYAAVLEADGTPMSVRTALQLINRFLAEDDFDPDTQWCLHWFEQHGWGEGVFGEADVLARAKATSVDGLMVAGVIQSGAGKVRLMKWDEYPAEWDPRSDDRLPIWEGLHQLIRALRHGGESASGALLAALGGKAESVRQLAYRLYTLCERQGWAEDARAYNELITSWSGVELAASSAPTPKDQELPGFGG